MTRQSTCNPARAAHDGLFEDILRGASAEFLFRLTGLALALAAHMLLAREIGEAGYGLYAIILGWCLIFAVPARLGLDQSARNHFGRYLKADGYGQAGAFLKFAAKCVACTSVLFGIVLTAPFAIGLDMFSVTSYSIGFWCIVLVAALSLKSILAACFHAAKRSFLAHSSDHVSWPAMFLLLVCCVVLFDVPRTLQTAMTVTALGAVGAVCLIMISCKAILQPGKAGRTDAAERRKWLNPGLTLLLAGVVYEAMAQSNIVLLGYLTTYEDAGHYAAASRLAYVIPYALLAVGATVAPMISAAHRRRDNGDLRRIARTTARMTIAGALVMGFVLVVAGRQILVAFGDGFEQAYPVLLVLLCGALIAVGTGSADLIMNGTVNHRQALGFHAVALIVSVCLAFALIPGHGILGGAIAATSGMVLASTLRYFYVLKRLGIDSSPIGLKVREAR